MTPLKVDPGAKNYGDPLEPSLQRIFNGMERAAKRSGRRLDEITLVAASKGVGLEKIAEAARFGVTVFGENRVQEAEEKFFRSGFLDRSEAGSVSLHLIGPLQTNKVKRSVGFFDLIHSIDSERLAEKLDQEAERRSVTQALLVEVNMGEESKRGVSVEETPRLVDAVRGMPHLSLLGLMTLPPPTPDPEGARPYFVKLRELGRTLGLSRLSMGMSADFEVAIEEGATWVRVGTALFGPREAGLNKAAGNQ
jgi:pyridoxal phosphate enzyme (YggS family)